MPKKTSKLPQETMLKIAITGSAGHHTVPVASVAELRDVLQRYLPDLAPYDLQAAAHLVVVQRTSIIAPRWQIRVMGEYVLQPPEAAPKRPTKRVSKSASAKLAVPTPAHDAAQSPPPPAPLFPPEEPEA